MTIKPDPGRTRFMVTCNRCGFSLALRHGDLTDGGIREIGWLPRGFNEHACPSCVRAEAAARRAGQEAAQ